MKRVAILLGIAALSPRLASAQLPVTSPPVPPTDAAAGPAETPPAAAPPGEQYFVEQAPPATDAPPAPAEPPFEPPPPGGLVMIEPPPPPPPPVPRHLAPKLSLWLGARVGWFFPFGNAWARAKDVSSSSGSGYVLEGVPWRDYANSGPMLELDAGARISRSYTVFALWERAQLRSGRNVADGKQDGAESDFWALGLRASSNPDGLGFLTEVAVGYRRARTFFEDGSELQFTDAPFEARLGLGGEWRFNRTTTLSSLLTIGVGGFGTIETVAPNGNALSKTRGSDEGDGHAWATLTIGGHFDLFGSAN